MHVENFIQVEFDTMHRKLVYQKKKKKKKQNHLHVIFYAKRKGKEKKKKKNICQVGAALDPSTLP